MNQDHPAPVRPAPRTFSGMVLAIGPGIVVAGSVMGSGELINTPLQAATFGFVLLWAVVLSCVIKYFLQVEIGRHCLVHQRTTVEALNLCPGPKWRGTSWIPLLYLAGYTVTLASLIGIVGATGGVLHAAWPLFEDKNLSARVWGLAMVALTQLLLWRGIYDHLEKLVAILVAGFSLSVVAGLILLQGTPYAIRWENVASGFTFSLGDHPRAAALAVVSLMGALGTTANELYMYPYWILEKGYGSHVGPVESPGWIERARGWTRVLQLDAGLATLLATVCTMAYFLLGAAILRDLPERPDDLDVVDRMSGMYTQTYGQWSRGLYLFGAFCTLYSTLVVSTAATGRMWSDTLSSLGYLDRRQPRSLTRCHQAVQTIYLVGIAFCFLVLPPEPQRLVVFGQYFSGIFNTPLLMFGICWFAFRTHRAVRMRWTTAVALLASVVVIVACVWRSLAVQFGFID